MMRSLGRIKLPAFGLIYFAFGLTNLGAAEIKGTVASATAEYATVTTDSDLGPVPGDKAEIFFKMAGTDIDVSVASGKVYEITGANIMVKIDKATGTVAKDQVVRFTSPNPRPLSKTGASASQAPPRPPPLPVKPAPSSPRPLGHGTVTTLDFNLLPVGVLSPETFADHGVHIIPSQGTPGIYATEPNMVIPPVYRNALLLAGDRQTSLTFAFDSPIKRFAIFRVGVAGGASLPTWKMKAYDKSGTLIASAGEKRGTPKTPKPFAVQGKGISRVELETDNRNGAGTWATWSSLPIVSFAFDPRPKLEGSDG